MNLTALNSRLAPMVSGWNRFWFAPANPTVLGAIRILTGLVTFYTLLAYTFDLQELVGADAWYNLPLRQEQYREAPVQYMPMDWPAQQISPPVKNSEDERYFAKYVERWGTPPPPPYPKTLQEANDYDAYRARWGIDPRQIIAKGRPVWSIWFHVTDPTWMAVVHTIIVVCSFLFLIGFGTRITSVLTWFGALCYIHRDPAALFGVDTMMTVLLLYLMIGPSGAALSVDRLLRCWWARRRGLPVPPLEASVSANLVLRLIQIHVCIIYISAGLSKLQGQTWWTGIAPWLTLANPEYSPMQFPIYVSLLKALAKTRWVFEIAMNLSSLGTLAFEIGYPFLIWRPGFRKLWLWFAVFLHLGIGAFLGLKTFSILMMAFNMAFLRPETVWWAIGRLTPQRWRPVDAEPAAEPQEDVQPISTAIRRSEKPAPKPVVAVQHKRKR